MNQSLQHLSRIEFVITHACTGKCKHCSEGDYLRDDAHIDGDAAARVVYSIVEQYSIASLMTFGGESLLHPDAVCKIHQAAKAVGIEKRQLITNGFFSRDPRRIRRVANLLHESGVNDILLSVDAFHQETIPLEPIKVFAEAVKETGTKIRAHPAWLVERDADNSYNRTTALILSEFEAMGIPFSKGNIIFPSGNALKYLSEYFDPTQSYRNPYSEDPYDLRAISVDPNGDVLDGNIYQTDILDILARYTPQQG